MSESKFFEDFCLFCSCLDIFPERGVVSSFQTFGGTSFLEFGRFPVGGGGLLDSKDMRNFYAVLV